MEEKRTIILEAAIRLFTTGGYHHTTMADIAGECNISKATLYKHFSSKEELLVEAFMQAGRVMVAETQAIEMQDNLSKKEKMIKKLTTVMRMTADKMEFMGVVRHEIPHNKMMENYKALFMEHHIEIVNYHKQMVIAAYGEEARDMGWDITFCLSGLMHELMSLHKYDEHDTYEQSAAFLSDCMDGIVQARKGKPPLFSDNIMAAKARAHSKHHKSMYIKDIRTTATCMPAADKEKVEAALAMLERHLNQGNAQWLIVDGMLAMLSEYPELQESTNKLRKAIDCGRR